MRVFAGKRVPPCGNAATVDQIIYRGGLSPLLSTKLSNKIQCFIRKGSVMRSARTIATLASVAAIACSILAFSWVGLALLGY
jgi:hypothetical protein